MNELNELIEILESKKVNCSRGMQKALREIDMSALARILNKLDEKYHIYFFRNMSNKTADYLREEMEIQKEFDKSTGNQKQDLIVRDIQNVCSVINTWTNELFDEVFEYPEFKESVNFNSANETIDTFYTLGKYARENGLLAIDGLEQKTDNIMFKKALELLLEGIEPFAFDELLENYKTQYINRMNDIFTMIIKGIRCIYDGDHPAMIKEKLRSICEE